MPVLIILSSVSNLASVLAVVKSWQCQANNPTTRRMFHIHVACAYNENLVHVWDHRGLLVIHDIHCVRKGLILYNLLGLLQFSKDIHFSF